MAFITAISNAGERIVAEALMRMGYQTNVDTKPPDSTDMEATNEGKKILIQVNTTVMPGTPSPLSSEEERTLRARATRLGCEPWEAKVQVDTSLHLVGKIEWRNLA